MSNKVKYSIIVPVYNRPEELKELILSISKQSFKNLEVIIVDDGSQISSREIFQNFKKKLDISYFFTENQGPALARNFGVKNANGEWIIFFDSDCTVPNNYFKILEKFLNNNLIDFFGGPDTLDDSFNDIQKSINFSMTSFLTTGGIRGRKKSIDKFLPRTFNMGVKKKSFNEVEGFSNIRYGEDLDLSYRLSKKGKSSALIDKAFVNHKRRSNLSSFFKQIYNSGRARNFLNNRHKGTFRFYHLLPSLFVIFFILSFLFYLIDFRITLFILIVYSLYFIIIFLSSSFINKNIYIGFLSIITTFIQFLGYGFGFLVAIFKD
ncbi:MAG: glycosyltransferase [Flammeovirgaceae bacterium TMED290]|nr:MAG: glycosyltransferase [Flammeovirgaceae bacterium TMED290]|tara:strand:- start:1093 stop:2055 length:963 start_codon:yes stop_codon:yes gene_type:complete